MAEVTRKDPIAEARQDIAADIKAIRKLLNDKDDRGRTFELRLGDAVARDIRGGEVTAHDGYSAGGGGGGGQVNGISDPVGSTVVVRDSGKGALVDFVHQEAAAAWGALGDALAALHRSADHLKKLDDLTGVAPKVERCELCERALAGSILEADPMYLFTDIGGRLPHNQRVCQWHYDVVRRPPHKIPDDDRIRRRYSSGRDAERATA